MEKLSFEIIVFLFYLKVIPLQGKIYMKVNE